MNIDESEMNNDFLQKMLQQMGDGQLPDSSKQAPPPAKITPTPGFCIKTKGSNEAKIFINICISDKIPSPIDISEVYLAKVIEDPDDYPPFRIPMSIGEPHAETDKVGKGCTAYDIVIHSTFFDKVTHSELFKGFMMTIALEGIENKFNLQLNRNWVILKNKKAMGSLQDHFIRASSKPVIMDMEGNKPLIQEVSNNENSSESLKHKGETPQYTIIQVPPKGHPEFLIAELKLPKVRTARTLTLDLGEDRIVLSSRSGVYFLDIFLPFDLVQADCGAQFNKITQILTITMPVNSLK